MEVSTKTVFEFLHPFSMIIAGVSQSGKTELLKKIIENKHVISPTPKQIVISYTENQSAYSDILNTDPCVNLVQGLDFDDSIFNKNIPCLIVIDDQMSDAVKTEKIQNLFIRGVHHSSTSLILISQNLYPQGKFGRDIRLNSHYIVIMKSPTFASQIAFLGRQIFPNNLSFLTDAYKKATTEPYSYLVLNLHPLCHDNLRVCQGIFNKKERIFFVPK